MESEAHKRGVRKYLAKNRKRLLAWHSEYNREYYKKNQARLQAARKARAALKAREAAKEAK